MLALRISVQVVLRAGGSVDIGSRLEQFFLSDRHVRHVTWMVTQPVSYRRDSPHAAVRPMYDQKWEQGSTVDGAVGIKASVQIYALHIFHVMFSGTQPSLNRRMSISLVT